MPELGFCGVSENWLLKECAHRHWAAICQEAGVASHRIVDSNGRRLYAAVVALELDGSPLSEAGENDLLRFEPQLVRFSSKRFFSRIQISASTGAKFEARMVSIFVRKPIFDDNVKIEAGHPDPLRSIEQQPAPSDADRLLGVWNAVRSQATDQDAIAFRHRICPTTEFNAARLLYFANFQTIVDRAEWNALDTTDMQFAATTTRRLLFYGNVNFDDDVEVHFSRVKWTGDERSHRAAVSRRTDGGLLAVLETKKIIARP